MGTATVPERDHAQATPTGPQEEFFPPHPPREETPEYRKTHEHLCIVKDTPCFQCGVRLSDIKRGGPGVVTVANPLGARDMETHHYPVQREYIDAVDYRKVAPFLSAHYGIEATVNSQEDLIAFVDSELNMRVLCDICHRSPRHGIHHLLVNDWLIQPFLFDGYVLVGTKKDEAAALAKDEQIVDMRVPESERA